MNKLLYFIPSMIFGFGAAWCFDNDFKSYGLVAGIFAFLFCVVATVAWTEG